ncbi:hypothetical protein SAMN05428949_6455 [Chitinophaga sp. YR627]|uniref:hypothetical protein n=1 Tax=Chitinophaga sp. YR627 TaxID=1881041 RepID=UPI0008EEBBA0|nr:hypothetical protein [Chitinophaga sp. YR627]SFO74769.1 hypothetical protein SAMN05428949_6455 [Chitinophaga sp. YR627]
MELLQTIIHYYQGEAKHGLLAVATGMLMLLSGILLWKTPLMKAFPWPLLLVGLVAVTGGATTHYRASREAVKKIALYNQDKTAFLHQETTKVKNIHKGWTRTFLAWGALGFLGLILAIRAPLSPGTGIITIVLAIIMSAFELYSKQFNEGYYSKIKAAVSYTQTPVKIKAPPRQRHQVKDRLRDVSAGTAHNLLTNSTLQTLQEIPVPQIDYSKPILISTNNNCPSGRKNKQQ